MSDSNETVTESELRARAYRIGLSLKNSGLDPETIYARLEKQGIPEALAREVAKDAVIEEKREVAEHAKTSYNVALIRVGVGLGAAAISAVVFPGKIFLPIGLVIGGIIAALVAKNKMNQ